MIFVIVNIRVKGAKHPLFSFKAILSHSKRLSHESDSILSVEGLVA